MRLLVLSSYWSCKHLHNIISSTIVHGTTGNILLNYMALHIAVYQTTCHYMYLSTKQRGIASQKTLFIIFAAVKSQISVVPVAFIITWSVWLQETSNTYITMLCIMLKINNELETDKKFVCLCVCSYQYLYGDTDDEESAVCVDINECSTGTHTCDVNAICVNEPGNFACQCKAGYTGDGSHCKSKHAFMVCSFPTNSYLIAWLFTPTLASNKWSDPYNNRV